MIAEIITYLLTDTLAKEVAAGVLVPGIGVAGHWVWRVTSRLKAIHTALLPTSGPGIMERIQSIEDSLQVVQEAQRWRDAHKTNEFLIAEYGSNGECLYASKAMSEAFGMDPQDMLGWGWMQAIVKPEERERVRRSWSFALEQTIPYSDAYVVRNQKTGERIRVRTHTHAVKNGNGKVLVILGYIDKVEPVRELKE